MISCHGLSTVNAKAEMRFIFFFNFAEERSDIFFLEILNASSYLILYSAASSFGLVIYS